MNDDDNFPDLEYVLSVNVVYNFLANQLTVELYNDLVEFHKYDYYLIIKDIHINGYIIG